MQLSVVIITRNEAANIAACIQSVLAVSDDIVVADCGSTDDTVRMAASFGARILPVQWKCFGHSRNRGAAHARHDWILAIDADERLSPELQRSIQAIRPGDPFVLFGFQRNSFFDDKQIRFGSWGADKVYRLYNRCCHAWDEWPVHERLVTVNRSRKKRLAGRLDHFPVSSAAVLSQKNNWYARLAAEKYRMQYKKAGWVKRYVSPAYAFVQSYILLLGFLDGREGWIIAREIACYTFRKYALLRAFESGGDYPRLATV